MAPVALDQTLAQRFWQVSEELCAQVLNRRP
jgi:hypothetical protein